MMERTDRRPILSAQINKIEPTFVPEWLKATANTSTHISEERGRNNYDIERNSITAERNSSALRRSLSTNGSQYNERERSIHLRPYNSFGRNKELNFLEKRKSGLSENGSNNFPDLPTSSRVKAYVNSSPNMVNPISKSSFERDFPSLGSEEKQGSHEVGRVQKLMGGDSWTSALAEVPTAVGSNGPNGSPSSMSSSMNVLNMAEALAHAPPQTRNAIPKISVETQRLEEFAIKQSRQLVPVTPSTSKASVLSPSEKLKPKISKGVDFSKAGQPVSHALRLSKPLQTGNFQVLNREKKNSNGVYLPARESLQSPTNNSSRSKSAFSKSDGRGTTLPVMTFIDRRPPVTQQNRSEFFNSLRKKTSAGTSSSASTSASPSTALEKPEGQETVGVDSVYGGSKVESSPDLTCDDGSNGGEKEKGSCLDPEEEERLLKLFGWKENTGDEEEEALTAEEIDAFMEEYQKRRPSSKFGRRGLNLQAISSTGDSEKSSESSLAERF